MLFASRLDHTSAAAQRRPLSTIRYVRKDLKTLVGRDGIEPPTPGFSLVCCALPRTSGYEEQNCQQLSEITYRIR